MELPYRAEYAKSGRSSCRGCKTTINAESLRLAVMVQSSMFDGRTPNWYHMKCFFEKQRPKTSDDIEHFESLRYEDQKKINEKISSLGSVIVPQGKSKGKGTKRPAKDPALKDFKIEYAKSARATCRGCELKILKNEIRISKKDFTTEVGKKYGGQDMWHHLSCFAKLRSELGYFESAKMLPGYSDLTDADQKEALNQIASIKQEPVTKKPKIEDETDHKSASADEKLIKQQNKLLFKYRDALKDNLKKSELQQLLSENNQEIPVGQERILDRLSDVMAFGALERCHTCKDGQFVFNKMGYVCTGNLTEWTKCTETTKEPKRKPFKIPDELAEKYSFLSKYKYVPGVRIFRDVNPTVAVKKYEDETDRKPKIERETPALYNMEFVILGKPKMGKDKLKNKIISLGGKVITKISLTTMAVISTESEVEKMGSRIIEAKESDVHVISEDFIEDCEKNTGKIPELIVKKSICDWGSDPKTRLPPAPSSSKSKSIYTKSVPSKMKMKMKSGGAIDPASGLEDLAHIYHEGKTKYNVTLGLTDIQTKRNSYYKLQLLQSDKKPVKFWIFRSWGRIGTTIGGNKLERMEDLHEAKHQFSMLYEEKSGNAWCDRDYFVKIPGKMCPIDIDHGDDNSDLKIVESDSKLDKPIQDLIKLIFDVDAMKNMMVEFEIDTEKMPLGKLSKKQIQNAFGVLNELQKLIDENGAEVRFIDASNRFYTFIPHSFGVDEPPLIKETEIIKKKLDMLDSLMELEIAYNLMHASGSDHTIDGYYSQLNTEIGVLSKDSETFKIIEEYVKNTHAQTHSSYDLELLDIFTVERKGENKRYKPFKKLKNKKLLWHGSRTANFAGILSQGLRIAPPEAPVTGYMFGKGIYFADMVSKSANYCCTNPLNSTGLLLLCEVALGDMYEKKQAEYVEKLPKGKHSTKGLGLTAPDPESSKFIGDVEVPIGKPTDTGVKKTSLLYNEYIVYDIAQVNIQYLLKVNFKYKY